MAEEFGSGRVDVKTILSAELKWREKARTIGGLNGCKHPDDVVLKVEELLKKHSELMVGGLSVSEQAARIATAEYAHHNLVFGAMVEASSINSPDLYHDLTEVEDTTGAKGFAREEAFEITTLFWQVVYTANPIAHDFMECFGVLISALGKAQDLTQLKTHFCESVQQKFGLELDQTSGIFITYKIAQEVHDYFGQRT